MDALLEALQAVLMDLLLDALPVAHRPPGARAALAASVRWGSGF